MKRLILLLTAVLALTGGARAESITVGSINTARSGKARLYVGIDNPDISWRAFQMDITLPDGFTMKATDNDADTPEVVLTDRTSGLFTMFSNYNTAKQAYSLAAFHSTSKGLALGSGNILYMTVVASNSVPDGTYTGTISGIVFTNESEQSVDFDNTTFTITVSGDYTGITLDEASTTALTATTEAADITVRRKFNADEWSTLVLPFDMTGDELAAAFGSTAKMAEFVEWTPSDDSDDDGHPYSISMIFKDKALSDGLEANHPVLIRLDHAITEFTVSGKVLDPEEEPAVTVNMTGSKKRVDRADFIGCYTPYTIEAEKLFISGNSFYYSTGKTKMNGFRGYFSVPDVVSDYYGSASSAKVNMIVGGGTMTGVRLPHKASADDAVYNLGGQRVGTGTDRLPCGIYIMGGKKILVK